MFIRETSTLDGTWGNAAVWIATSRAISRGNACGTRGYKRPRLAGTHPQAACSLDSTLQTRIDRCRSTLRRRPRSTSRRRATS